MKKRLITFLSVVAIIATTASVTHIGTFQSTIPSYDTRTIGNIYITVDTGVVLDDAGNGMITSPDADPYYNYIKYSAGDYRPGASVTTVCIYNPLTNYSDDIIARFDF